MSARSRRVVVPAPHPHRHAHDLPDGRQDGDVARCCCGAWLVWVEVEIGMRWGYVWDVVRWRDRSARRRIRRLP